jgi:hypothetical protein
MDRRQFFTNFVKSAACSVSASLGPDFYTNAVFRTHENKEVRFYDDLIKGKSRVGRDIFMYSISLKPEEDDPATLKEYARMHRTKPGWLFLTGRREDVDTLRFRLLTEHHPAIDLNIEQHTGMIRVINDANNRWFCSPSQASVETIVQTIRWAENSRPLAQRMRENAIAQAKIDKMQDQMLPTWLSSLNES